MLKKIASAFTRMVFFDTIRVRNKLKRKEVF